MDQLQQTLLLQQDYLRHSSSFAEQPEKRNDLNTIVPFIRIDSAISTTTTTSTNANPITIALEKPSCYTYLPGEIIQGTVTVEPPSNFTRKRVDIHLACSFRETTNSQNTIKKQKKSIFKVMLNPIWLPPDIHHTSFSLNIPSDLPAYDIHDESMHGKIDYKIKAIYEIATDLPLSLYPKTSIPIMISAQISTADLTYNIPMQTKKQISITIPRDVTLKNKKLRKGERGTVSAQMFLKETCFVPGQNISFSLQIQHIAPIKQIQGIQIMLEKIVRAQQEDGSDALDTHVVHKIVLPFICDLEDYSAIIDDEVFPIPGYISPTIQMKEGKIRMPFYIQYHLKILINMDMHHFLEDIPLRKRDRAYSMMNKIVGSLEQDGPAFFYGTTIELDFPVIIGTTTTTTLQQGCELKNRKVSQCSISSTHSLSNLLISSPIAMEEEHPSSIPRNTTINRFDSDPSFNRTTTTNFPRSMVQQHQFLSTVSLFNENSNINDDDSDGFKLTMNRPPSAPPLADLYQKDTTSPPPYLE